MTLLEARYGGSEANVALSLANLGIDSSYFTVVPDNSLGKSAIRMMKSNDVDCTPVIFSTSEETPTHRLGTYYLETGYGIRPSKVIYDRKHSAFDEYDFTKVDLEKLLDGYTWLHLSGITPALGERCRKMIMDCLKIAKKNGITVSFDGNFRSTLWSWEEAREFCTACLPYVDVLMGIEPYHLWKDENNYSAGDVHNPYLNETFYAISGEGAYMNGNAIHVSKDDLANSIVLFGSSPYNTELAKASFELAYEYFQKCLDIRRSGSAALDLCAIASGRAEIYFELILSPWDFASIEEAGRFAAAMSTLKIEKSGPFNGNKEDVVHCIETAEEMF